MMMMMKMMMIMMAMLMMMMMRRRRRMRGMKLTEVAGRANPPDLVSHTQTPAYTMAPETPVCTKDCHRYTNVHQTLSCD